MPVETKPNHQRGQRQGHKLPRQPAPASGRTARPSAEVDHRQADVVAACRAETPAGDRRDVKVGDPGRSPSAHHGQRSPAWLAASGAASGSLPAPWPCRLFHRVGRKRVSTRSGARPCTAPWPRPRRPASGACPAHSPCTVSARVGMAPSTGADLRRPGRWLARPQGISMASDGSPAPCAGRVRRVSLSAGRSTVARSRQLQP